jgi:hypothetical protein
MEYFSRPVFKNAQCEKYKYSLFQPSFWSIANTNHLHSLTSSLASIVSRFHSTMAPALFHAATLALRAAGTCSSQPMCPQEDKCNYITNNESFQVNCATDFYGGDLKNIQVCLNIVVEIVF